MLSFFLLFCSFFFFWKSCSTTDAKLQSIGVFELFLSLFCFLKRLYKWCKASKDWSYCRAPKKWSYAIRIGGSASELPNNDPLSLWISRGDFQVVSSIWVFVLGFFKQRETEMPTTGGVKWGRTSFGLGFSKRREVEMRTAAKQRDEVDRKGEAA